MDNLKKFSTEAEYSAATLNYPAVSWVVSGDTVYFDKEAPIPPIPMLGDIKNTYNVDNTSWATTLYNVIGSGSGSGSGAGGDAFTPSRMWIDGVEVEVANTYTFSTLGEHVVEFKLAEGVTSIGQQAFDSCRSLTSCTIGSGVTSIGMNAFGYCTSLTSINIPNSVTNIGDMAFYHCSGLTSIVIPDSVTSIGGSTFEGCTSLTSCTIGSGVTSIGITAFFRCTSLTSINIPSGITNINLSVFQSCSSLTSIDIPSGVTSIGGWAFGGCSSLISITVEAATPPTLGEMAFTDTNNCTIYVLAESVNTYKTASGWSNLASRIQAIP